MGQMWIQETYNLHIYTITFKNTKWGKRGITKKLRTSNANSRKNRKWLRVLRKSWIRTLRRKLWIDWLKYTEYYMSKSVSYAVTTRDSYITPKVIDRGLIQRMIHTLTCCFHYFMYFNYTFYFGLWRDAILGVRYGFKGVT